MTVQTYRTKNVALSEKAHEQITKISRHRKDNGNYCNKNRDIVAQLINQEFEVIQNEKAQ